MKKLLIGLLLLGSSFAYADCSQYMHQFNANGEAAVVGMWRNWNGPSVPTKALITKDKNVRSRFIVTKVNYHKCAPIVLVGDMGTKYCQTQQGSTIDSYQLLSLDNKCFIASDQENGYLKPIYEIIRRSEYGYIVTWFLKEVSSEREYIWQTDDTIHSL